MRKVFVSTLVLSLCLGLSIDVVAKRKSTRAAKRTVVRAGRSTTSTSSSSSSKTTTVADSTYRFVADSAIYEQKLEYGVKYDLATMLLPSVSDYYKTNGSEAINEQLCFGPYMTLTGISTSGDIVEYTADGAFECQNLLSGYSYTLQLKEATKTTLATFAFPRMVKIVRSGVDVNYMQFEYEPYVDISEFVPKIATAVMDAKTSCQAFYDDMEKLKGQLGWTTGLSGVGTALSAGATGVGVYNVMKTNEVDRKLTQLGKNNAKISELDKKYTKADESKEYFPEDCKGKNVKEQALCLASQNSTQTENAYTQTENAYTQTENAYTQAKHKYEEVEKEYFDDAGKIKKDKKDSIKRSILSKYDVDIETATEKQKNFEDMFNFAKVKLTKKANGEGCTMSECGKNEDSFSSNCVGTLQYFGFDTSKIVLLGDKCDKDTYETEFHRVKNLLGDPIEKLKAEKQKAEFDLNLRMDTDPKGVVAEALSGNEDKIKFDEAKSDLDSINSDMEQLDNLNKKKDKLEKQVKSSVKTSRTLDIVQGSLNIGSAVTSVGSLALSVAGIKTAESALSNLKECKSKISELKLLYNTYKAELEDNGVGEE